MLIIEIFKNALQTLRSNKMRTFLTMLGIIIGIMSVTLMWSIGRGAQEDIMGAVKEAGYGKFDIAVDIRNKNFKQKYLLDDKALEDLKKIKEVKNVYMNMDGFWRLEAKNGEKMSERRMVQSDVMTPSFYEVFPNDIVGGRYFLPFEYSIKENVLLLDSFTAKDLFIELENAIGQEITLIDTNNTFHKYKIVGVFKNPMGKIGAMMGSENMPVFVRIPIENYLYTANITTKGFSSVFVEATDPEDLEGAIEATANFLENRYGVREIFKVSNSVFGQVDTFDNILSTFNMFVTLAAAISLCVGGIGVMNIMLVTVIERIKEIGIRKALGATNGDILLQFLMESIMITLLGGIIGMILGIIISSGIGRLIDIKPVFSIYAMATSLVISISIGVIFGVSPARKASKLNPIEALRAE